MGVHGLWDLLAPVGRRVSVETLAGKKLAIDASIWMVQFMKAMRDEKGEMVRNAHLLGFFRRICKLLFLRIKPVFVFDGGTPALKRRTVIARRRQRENAQAKIRKTAEKLLLNHLKAMRLKELAKDLENQRKEQKNNSKGKQTLDAGNDMVSKSHDYEKMDEMLGASVVAEEEERQSLNVNASTSDATSAGPVREELDGDEDEEFILPAIDENIDPAILAALPPSMQLDLLMREKSMVEKRESNQKVKKDMGNQNEKHRNKAKGKEILSDQNEMERNELERGDAAAESYNLEKLDEMLAASIMAEEDERLTKNASASAAINISDEGGDDDEEMILPHGNVDPAVLAALPPSMQLDLLVQMREKLMAENRQRYQKVKKAPEQFSELQIKAYLKTVAFRREIDQVQKAAAGKGVGGVQTSRIASEANREFIFSSSFTGDKESLTSTGFHKNGDEEQQKSIYRPSSDFMDGVASISKSNGVTGFVPDESSRAIDDDVETYLDERGHIRVSRVRAMGMRMTRDLQRNLDLMKEIEQERMHAVKTTTPQSILNRNKVGSQISSPSKNHKSSHCNSGDPVNFNERDGQSLNDKTLQISFEVNGESKSFDSDDDIFASLVAGKHVQISSADNSAPSRQSYDSASDGDWEEGIIGGKDLSSNDIELRTNPSLNEKNISNDSEIEWEDGACDVNENSSCPAESEKPVSKGYLEEQADLQEAIRRSLEDLGGEKQNYSQSGHEQLKTSGENAYERVGILDQDDNTGGPTMLRKYADPQNQASKNSEVEKVDAADRINISQAFSSPERHVRLCEANNPDNTGMLINKSFESQLGFNSGQSSQDENKKENLCRDVPSVESVNHLEAKEIHLHVEQSSGIFVEGGGMCSGDGSHISEAVSGDLPYAVLVDNERNYLATEPSMSVNEKKMSSGAEPLNHSIDITNPSTYFMEPSARDSTNDSDIAEKLGAEKNSDDQLAEECYMDKSAIMGDENAGIDLTEASLEEEMLNLGQERMNLGDEQRKLERNAESVSSEMLAECQELLQMFGLPYIIAPMEAEAQCAYMELANLVDGVVTDDSDVFLFGGRSVYKNIFDERKYVETYFMKDIEKELGLTREKLIRMSMLLGSDYTEGISGIGIVNAIEVVNAFPEEDGLHKFREWIESPDPTILGKLDVQTGSSMGKKGSKVSGNDSNCTSSDMEGITPDQNIPQAQEENQSADHVQEIKQIFMDTHRNVSKNWHIPPPFPSEAVMSAYSSPQVDKSTEPFTWGKPDLQVLQRLCWEKFGWSIQKSDELLQPVLREYNKHETQLRLEAFYSFNERFAKIRSKRIKKAVKGITGKQSLDLMDDPVEEVPKGRRRRTITGISSDDQAEKHSKRTEESAPGGKNKSLEKSNTKRSRKRKTTGELILSDIENPETNGGECSNKGLYRKGRGRGRGRGRGQGMRRKGTANLGFEQSDSSSSDINSSDEQEINVDMPNRPQELRRSTRARKSVNYALNDLDINDVDKEAVEQCSSQAQVECRDLTPSLSNKDRHEVEDHSTEDFSKDYFESESGFCTEEGDIGHPDVSQNSNLFEGNDYLKIGGGFCLDESESSKDQGTACSPSTAAVQETLSGFMEEVDYGSGSIQSMSRTLSEFQDGGKTSAFDTDLNMDCENAINAGDYSNVSLSPPEIAKNNTGASRLGGLNAMPFLKRKGRKS